MRPAIALYQPDIAGNTGTLMRLAACTGTDLHIVEPAGFRTDDTALRRAGMDYAELAAVTRYADFEVFDQWRHKAGKRLILLTTKADTSYTGFSFSPADILLLGRESAGVPESLHQRVDASVTIRMQKGARSLNQAISGAMALGEALRQTTV